MRCPWRVNPVFQKFVGAQFVMKLEPRPAVRVKADFLDRVYLVLRHFVDVDADQRVVFIVLQLIENVEATNLLELAIIQA
jgi:hypothetical protein